MKSGTVLSALVVVVILSNTLLVATLNKRYVFDEYGSYYDEDDWGSSSEEDNKVKDISRNQLEKAQVESRDKNVEPKKELAKQGTVEPKNVLAKQGKANATKPQLKVNNGKDKGTKRPTGIKTKQRKLDTINKSEEDLFFNMRHDYLDPIKERKEFGRQKRNVDHTKQVDTKTKDPDEELYFKMRQDYVEPFKQSGKWRRRRNVNQKKQVDTTTKSVDGIEKEKGDQNNTVDTTKNVDGIKNHKGNQNKTADVVIKKGNGTKKHKADQNKTVVETSKRCNSGCNDDDNGGDTYSYYDPPQPPPVPMPEDDMGDTVVVNNAQNVIYGSYCDTCDSNNDYYPRAEIVPQEYTIQYPQTYPDPQPPRLPMKPQFTPSLKAMPPSPAGKRNGKPVPIPKEPIKPKPIPRAPELDQLLGAAIDEEDIRPADENDDTENVSL
ncbi:hypothetical protein WDU94_007006 [Cyamophila willieti]